MIVTTLFYRFKTWLQTHPKTALALAAILLSLIVVSITSAFFMPPMLAGLALIPKLGAALASLILMSGPAAPFVFGLIASMFLTLNLALGYGMQRLLKSCCKGYEKPNAFSSTEYLENLPMTNANPSTPVIDMPERDSTSSSDLDDDTAPASPPRSQSAPQLANTSQQNPATAASAHQHQAARPVIAPPHLAPAKQDASSLVSVGGGATGETPDSSPPLKSKESGPKKSSPTVKGGHSNERDQDEPADADGAHSSCSIL